MSPSHSCIRPANMASDWIHINLRSVLGPEIQKGIDLHHKMDSFTDAHSAVKEMNAHLRPILRKYSPVGSDLLIDFFLAHHWYLFHNCSYADFCSDVYAQLLCCRDKFPKKVALRFQRMGEWQWLNSLPTSQSWSRVLKNMDKRARYESNFIGMEKEILTKFSQYRQLFERFYRDCMETFPSEYHKKL